ncbi:MAG: hypothetical protein CMF61_02935 [Magnetococcales bacterium]|nr:hypothetical protein [Magnetococcales bacterium]PPR19477.1 MAG: hypothetical protein CFH43_00158 [Pseudomonadota bacterium]
MYKIFFLAVLFLTMHHSFANAQDDVDIKETPDEVQLTFEHRQFTATEVQVLQELEKRRVILDRREKALELRERLVDLAEKRLSEKTSSMEILKSQLEQLLANLSDKEEGELKELAKIYEEMKAESAASVMNRMDNKIVFDVFKRMSRKSTAKIMEKMDTGKARLISEMLAEKSELPLFNK